MHSAKAIQGIFAERLDAEAKIIGATKPVLLYQPIAYTLGMGGKRLRPVMLLMACELFGGKIEEAMNAALAIEIFHNFTLLHDDIMDHADLRRNMPTVHKKYNENIAILSGDAMSNMANQYLLKTKTGSVLEIAKLFSQTAIEVCEGQQYDMNFEDSMDVTISDYLEMIRLKTAVLMACSLKIGALTGNAPVEEAEKMYRFGINLGLAFQLQDDLLDVFADQDVFGKKIGGDIVSNKKTFLLLKSLELASPEQRSQLIRWINKPEFEPSEKIKAVKKIYTDLNVKEASERVMDSYYQLALNELETVNIEHSRKTELVTLAERIMKRDR